MDMISLMSKFKEYVKPLNNGNIELSIPKDVNNPTKDNCTKIELSMQEAIKLMSYYNQTKQYEIATSGTDKRVVCEGDADFDINKWIQLAIGTVKEK